MIHLADHLEHQLDLEVLYHRNDTRRLYMTPYRHFIIAMAEELRLFTLVAELKQAYDENDAAKVAQELRSRTEAALIPPRSCKRRINLNLSHSLHSVRLIPASWRKFRQSLKGPQGNSL
jgi:hypothetical protein